MPDTKKVARVVTEYKTLNSTYQVDEGAKRFRRVTGVNPTLVGPDGEWVDYTEKAYPYFGNTLLLTGVDTAGRALRTSTVQSVDVIALTA